MDVFFSSKFIIISLSMSEQWFNMSECIDPSVGWRGFN